MAYGKRDESLTGNFDWLTVLLYVVLVIIGWLTIYSAVYSEESSSIFDPKYNSGKQFQWMIVCGVLAMVILIIDSKFYTTFAYVLYGLILLSIIGVMLFGVKVKGQQNWIRIGSFQMQPSELVKFATALALSKFLSNLNVDIRKWGDKWKAFAIIAVPMLMIVVQGDAGSAVVFIAFSLPLFREGLESFFITRFALSMVYP